MKPFPYRNPETRDRPIIANVMGPDQMHHNSKADSLIRAHNVCDNWSITGAKNMIRLHQMAYLLTYLLIGLKRTLPTMGCAIR